MTGVIFDGGRGVIFDRGTPIIYNIYIIYSSSSYTRARENYSGPSCVCQQKGVPLQRTFCFILVKDMLTAVRDE